ncbi:hypothetical protein [Variovorax arabinosiphilus]|uniref:hypothetical protein n=1 Tax=Variovorax arabinosiphilus TaxID=3053498 RepID=UPI00257610CB|nr:MULTISPECIES: hypothetical protein [unclassified Variovorax]MDM0118901.1 hypothetical protein [Variovorax sp. J2L1-78]MDM0129326.1 hypothetical protein [Variovorax sp. J2L1-63]MDM0232887.1 hypothetical protein [Variovorax sp. J2R1-6]
MALSIISPHPASLPDDIHLTEQIDHDEYRGPLVSLTAAGIIRSDQLPPEGKCSIAYSQGQIILRKCRRDETYLRIEQYEDGTARVLVGVQRAVAEVRRDAAIRQQVKARQEAMAMAKKRESMRDPGIDAVRVALHDSPAAFKVGDLCMHVDGHYLEIVEGYGLYGVWMENGRYLDEETNKAFDYKFGYTARELGKGKVFYPAHVLLDAEGETKHLTLVRL